MIIIGCSHGKHLAQKIAKKLKSPYSNLEVEKFPDNEIGMRIISNVKGKIVVLVQSFYENINDCVVEVIFAVDTLKELGAKEIILIAPYFPYLRKDKSHEVGDCVSAKVMGKLVSKYFDKVFIVDPHIRIGAKLSNMFQIKAKKLTSNTYIVDYIRKNVKNPLIIGPDKGSLEMAKNISEKLKCNYIVMDKKRQTGRNVNVTFKNDIDIKNKNIVFVDDMISTGNTILECVKIMKKIDAKEFNCVVVHGVLVENALEKLKKANVNVITTNTIPNNVAKIDVSGLIAEALKG